MKKDLSKVFGKMSYGMYVLTTDNGGCIVDAACQISSYDSPLIAVSVNKQNYTNELLHKNNKFALSIIGMNTNTEIIKTYGFNSMRDYDKFANSKTENVDGLNIIPDSIGYLICEKIDMIENDTHTLFIGKVVNGNMLNEDKEMTYNYYREHKNELIKVKTENNKTAWVCTICGYVYYGEELPEDYKCPVCGVTSDLFEKTEK